MGVPAFFRWLSRKYPAIVVHCIEEKAKIVDGVKIPIDASKPNPNDVEFDNLYLDMNGIIHPCCHPENKPAPKDEDEMMVAIFEYIDMIFNIVRPRRLLYMAIDGVAPRAKMNQQRSRRFRASKESTEKVELISQIRNQLEIKGIKLPPEKPKEEHFDSNCITPGTPFMDRLAKCLHYYIHDRLNNDPGWRNIEVILSDANVPGEGEHKIMDFIRRQRATPGHDANTRHCLCGADADLIMLGLATHEPNFTIIREEFKPNQPRPCELCGQIGHDLKECTGSAKEKQGEFDELTKPIVAAVEFIFIRLNVLREYLAKELRMENLPFQYDVERVIDDWVFMCFFVGNDFLPHLPSLEIREGAIDRLVKLYKNAVYKTGGFLTDSGFVELARVQCIMAELGEAEDEIFKRRQINELNFQAREKSRRKRFKGNDNPAWRLDGHFAPQAISEHSSPVPNARHEAYQKRMASTSANAYNQGDNRNKLQSMMKPGDSEQKDSEAILGEKRKNEDDDEEPETVDEVKLWEDGFKDRYYDVKFKVTKNDVSFRHKVAAAYVEGLCWVLRYYYQGCASWNWYFPYHYAPFASDFINIGDIDIKFDKGKPFNPLEQLMAVFPAGSKQHVPEPWGDLMSNPESDIIDFYPTDFKIDLNGKKYAWQGVALLPFVDEQRLLKALKPYYKKLTSDEVKRNIRGKDRLYVRQGHGGYDFLHELYNSSSNLEIEIDMSCDLFHGMNGKVILSEDVIGYKETVISPVQSLPDLSLNSTVCISFLDPQFSDSFVFPAKRLEDAVDPKPVLRPGEMPVTNFRQFGEFRPRGGMASLDASGHRMINRNMHNRNPQYGNVPPPYHGGQRSYNSYGRPPHERNNPSSFHSSGPYNRQRDSWDSRRQSSYSFQGAASSAPSSGSWRDRPSAGGHADFRGRPPQQQYPTQYSDRRRPNDRGNFPPSSRGSYYPPNRNNHQYY